MKRGTEERGTVNAALTLLVGCALLVAPLSGAALAQDDFAECQRTARQESGYRGAAPGEGNVLGDAIGGAIFGAIVGGSEGAKKGAAAGAVLGGAQRSAQQRQQARLQQAYQAALERCMERKAAVRKATEAAAREATEAAAREAREAAARAPQTDPLAAAGEGAFDLERMTSWTVLSASSDDRASLLLLLYGYVAGMRYEAVQSPTKIEGTLGSFNTYAQPTDKAAIAAVSQALSNVADGPSSETFNLTKITCWDLDTSSDEVYPYLSLLAYGYAAGQLGDSVQSPEKIARTIQSGGNVCQGLVGMELVEVYRRTLSQ